MLVQSFKAPVSPRSKSDREAAIGLLMAIIIRCFESLLSLVRATLPVSRALAKFQKSYGKENEKKKEEWALRRILLQIWKNFGMFSSLLLNKVSVPPQRAHEWINIKLNFITILSIIIKIVISCSWTLNIFEYACSSTNECRPRSRSLFPKGQTRKCR